ncbi:MAG: hypothetical protein CSB44_02665 [Gammaproteobacteria bacterium]|nr:MAG: hypothetical protein CSB44_02665 [Gammaproteobacteria bacterium]
MPTLLVVLFAGVASGVLGTLGVKALQQANDGYPAAFGTIEKGVSSAGSAGDPGATAETGLPGSASNEDRTSSGSSRQQALELSISTIAALDEQSGLAATRAALDTIARADRATIEVLARTLLEQRNTLYTEDRVVNAFLWRSTVQRWLALSPDSAVDELLERFAMTNDRELWMQRERISEGLRLAALHDENLLTRALESPATNRLSAEAEASLEFALLIARASTDPRGTLEGLRDGSISTVSADRIDTYVFEAASRWLAQSPDDAFDWLEAELLGPAKPGPAMTMVLSAMVETDPKRATALIHNLPAETVAQMPDLAWMQAEAMARQDPLEALQWARTLPAETELDTTMAIYERWAEDDPEAALAHLARQPDSVGNERMTSQLVYSIGSALLYSDPEAAMALAREHNSGYDDIQNMLFQEWLATAPKDAIAWIQSGASEAADLLPAAISGIAYTNAEAGMALWPQLDIEQQQAVAEEVATGFYLQSPSTYEDWSATLDPAISKQADIGRLRAMIETDVESAMNEVAELSGPERAPLLTQIVGSLVWHSPDKLDAWLQTIQLTSDEREAVDDMMNGDFMHYR